MFTTNQLLIVLTAILALSSQVSAFWFGAEEPKPSNARVLYQPSDYYRQYLPPPLPYLPIQVPLPAQLAPATIQNVQLVPCLCPVNQEYPYDNDMFARKAPVSQQSAAPTQQKRRR